MKCGAGMEHHPSAQILPDRHGAMRCSICGRKVTFDAAAFTHPHASVNQLFDILLRHGMEGFAVTFYNGAWQAGLRTRAGLGPTVKGHNPVEAIRNLIFTLEEK